MEKNKHETGMRDGHRDNTNCDLDHSLEGFTETNTFISLKLSEHRNNFQSLQFGLC